jgi:hypothetical protein
VQGGQVVAYRNLDRIWQESADEAGFVRYVRLEISQSLQEARP